ncbi:uncharacterized protein LOC102673039 isoform X2 [Apis dorsata]|uniref:uncharacterized protein LOC102673039 isoform X2 n=1 Tax=Apis dorsata TaxID=7462 RepID=UPI001292F41F|nr:uncharacterized protein LOC102673039 isoform X2 [Apis dorsata]
MIFSVEIWEHIFTYIDPVSLTHLKIICKCWKQIIDKMLKESTLWYKLCKNKIPEHYWTILCETLNPNKFYTNFHEKHDAKFWMAMYKLWIKCKNMIKCNTQITCIEPDLKNHPLEYITCIDTSESFLAVGTSEGFIYFYNICNLNANVKYIIDHMEYIKKTNIICISCSINNHVNFWDMNTLKIINKTHGKLICTSYSYCYTAMHNIISIEGSIPKTIFQFGSDSIITMGADNNKVLFYTERGYYVNLKLDEKNLEKKNYTLTYIQPPNIRIRQYYTFKPNIIACITEYGYLGFLIEGKEWKIHNLFPILHGEPTAILVYGHILILGLNSGNVHIYYIDDFEAINFDILNSKKLSLGSTAVISLNIMVCIEEYLIIGYSNKIYIVNFV